MFPIQAHIVHNILVSAIDIQTVNKSTNDVLHIVLHYYNNVILYIILQYEVMYIFKYYYYYYTMRIDRCYYTLVILRFKIQKLYYFECRYQVRI